MKKPKNKPERPRFPGADRSPSATDGKRRPPPADAVKPSHNNSNDPKHFIFFTALLGLYLVGIFIAPYGEVFLGYLTPVFWLIVVGATILAGHKMIRKSSYNVALIALFWLFLLGFFTFQYFSGSYRSSVPFKSDMGITICFFAAHLGIYCITRMFSLRKRGNAETRRPRPVDLVTLYPCLIYWSYMVYGFSICFCDVFN